MPSDFSGNSSLTSHDVPCTPTQQRAVNNNKLRRMSKKSISASTFLNEEQVLTSVDNMPSSIRGRSNTSDSSSPRTRRSVSTNLPSTIESVESFHSTGRRSSVSSMGSNNSRRKYSTNSVSDSNSEYEHEHLHHEE
eukprot:Pgem_evm1s13951